MSTVASALSIAGSRTSGAPVRTQNGKCRKFIKKISKIQYINCTSILAKRMTLSHRTACDDHMCKLRRILL